MALRWDGIWVLAAAAVAWRGLLELGPSGEEYALVGQLRAGAPPGHVFRPLADQWIAGIAAATDLDFAPLGFWLQGLLHGLNGVLLLHLARALGAGRAGSLAIAVLFVLGAGVADSLAWLAAANRPLSTFGALIALLGAVRFARPPARGGGRGFDLGCAAAGFLWQYLVNEEVYGTALLLALWLGCFAPVSRPRRILLAVLPVVAVAAHFLVLRGSATGAAGRSEFGASHYVTGVLERDEHMLAGLAIAPAAAHYVLGFAGLALAVARRRRLLLFGLALLLAALVPFALDPFAAYRYYPSQAPIALLVGGALAVLGEPVARRVGSWIWLLVPLLGFAASEGPRRARLEEWGEATAFVRDFDRVLAERPDSAPRALLGLDSSVRGVLAARRPESDFVGLPSVAVLDTHVGYVRPESMPPGPWIGRTFRGEIAWIDAPERYFGDRIELAPVGLVDRAIPAANLDEAHEALWDPAFDPRRAAVVEAPAGALAQLVVGAVGQLETLQPLTLDPGGGQVEQRFAVTTPAPMLLVVAEPWSFGELWRFSEDQAVAQRVGERRVVLPSATDGATGAEFATFRANAHGAAVLVPAGSHTVVLRWRVASPMELR
ncbi:MAG: hypothetical protein GC161_17650 [Planctomycetaceae bacterium]|nr:hypothetical protein [Planctomycetaceae bacterium]